MRKICFVTTTSYALKNFVQDVAQYLHEEGGYDITFICNSDDDFKAQLPSYINFIPVKMKRGIRFEGLKVIWKLYQIFKREKFDMIQYSTPNAALYSSIAGKMSGINVRLYCQWGIRYVGFYGIKRRIFKRIEKIICKNSTWIEPDSYGNLNFAIDEKLYKKSNSSVIWNGSACGVNLKKFDFSKKEKWRKEIRKKYNISDNSIVIGYIGRLEKDKGINELLEAFKSINDNNLKLLIVGPNDKPKTINAELYAWAKNNENIIFCGTVYDTEKYYSAMDIFVLPSYREGFGSVVVEAESMGVPVIVTNIPGPTDAMEENKTGIVVECKNVKSLIDGINILLKNSNLMENYSSKCVEFAKVNFNRDKLFKFILEDRNRLLEKNN